MTQPTEQQLKDPTWWAANDPTGGKATHYWPEMKAWYRVESLVFVWEPLSKDSWARCTPGKIEEPGIVPRPEPRSQEWDGEGLPPVGCECEFKSAMSRWQTVIVKYASEHGSVVELGSGVEDFVSCTFQPEFRPLRAKEQIDRDELIDEAWSAIKQDYSSESKELTHPQEYVLNAICQLYDAGMLRKGGE